MQELACLLLLIPLDPGVLAVVESCQGIGNDLERLRLLANADDHTGLDSKRRNVDHLAIDDDMTMADELTGSCAGGSEAQTEHHVVESALKVLQQHLTGDAFGLGSLFEEDAEVYLAFCFSASMTAYSDCLRRRLLPCCPGGKFLLDKTLSGP